MAAGVAVLEPGGGRADRAGQPNAESPRPRAWGTPLAVLAAAWLAAGALTGVQFWILAALRGTPPSLARQVVAETLGAAAWLPVGTLVALAARRLPLGRRSWPRHLPLHMAGAAAVSFVVNVAISALWWVADVPLPEGFWGTTVTNSLAFLHLNALMYWLIVAAVHAVAYHQAARSRELRLARVEGQLAAARLHALQAQLHPHFLFNALHTVAMLWRTNRTDEAYDTLERLGAILRRMLDGSGEAEVPLGEELDFVREYLAIERSRLRDRLRVEIDAPPEVLEARVPALLLQPLVENAIRHGIAPHSSAGRLTVRAWRAGASLRIAVRDDGPGLPLAAAFAGQGVGLRNTRERLRQLHGERQHLFVGDAPGGGCLVEVELPYQPADGGRRPG
jgi:two-component system, LytTR family, sensor kinase